MTKKNITTIALSFLLMTIPTACSEDTATELHEGLRLYRMNRLRDGLPHLQRAARQDQDNPEALAWLAETYRRLERFEEAAATADKTLELDSCHSFALTVLGSVYNPMYGIWRGSDRDFAWNHLLKAVTCDPTDGNAWLDIWTETLYRGEPALETQALQAFLGTGILTPALLEYNRWMLRHLPDSAILLTNGDMDTYPAVALQHVEGFRTDVAVVNYSLLNTGWYARLVRDRYGLPLPFTEAELNSLSPSLPDSGNSEKLATRIMRSWLNLREAGSLIRPIAISVTVGDVSFASETADHLCLMGAYKLWLPEPAPSRLDTAMVRASLASVELDDFSGSFVSTEDRSSVRISSTDRVVANITSLAVDYSEALLESERASEAISMLAWAERFENNTVLGPVFAERIQELREATVTEMRR
jgi:tetratricopeptide (TPR) repeat protein